MLNNWNPPLAAPPLLSRRHFLGNTAGGIGGIALAWLLHRERSVAAAPGPATSARATHFPAKAKRIVQIFLLRRRQSSGHV